MRMTVLFAVALFLLVGLHCTVKDSNAARNYKIGANIIRLATR